MGQDAADRAIEHADQLSAARPRDAEQLFRREAERVLLVHRRDIVEPVEIRDRLQIGLVLDQFFGAAMKQADMRINPRDHFAVEHKTYLRSEEHTSELQSHLNLVCRLLLEKKKKINSATYIRLVRSVLSEVITYRRYSTSLRDGRERHSGRNFAMHRHPKKQ